jgi:hypothetical protein
MRIGMGMGIGMGSAAELETIAAPYHATTDTYIAQVEAAGGAIIDLAATDTEIRRLDNAGLLEDCLFYVNRKFGFVKDGGNLISKAIGIGGIIATNANADATQPTWHATNGMVFTGANVTHLRLNKTAINLGPQNAYTISAWFNLANGVYGHIISRRGGISGSTCQHQLMYSAAWDGIFCSSGGTARFSTKTAFDDSAWHHVAMVVYLDGATWKQKLYIDGALADCTTDGSDTVTSGTTGTQTLALDTLIGARYNNAPGTTLADAITGKLDGIAVWNKSLSAADVLTLYNSGNGRL